MAERLTPAVCARIRPLARLAEDVRATFDIELQELLRRNTHREADGKNAAGRCSCDQIKVAANRLAGIFFQRGEEGRGTRPVDAPTVDGEDAPDRRSVLGRLSRRVCVHSVLTLSADTDRGRANPYRGCARHGRESPIRFFDVARSRDPR